MNKTPYWLHPKDPRYWAHHRKIIAKEYALLAEAEAPKEVTFTFRGCEKLAFEEAIRKANEFYGTQSHSRAISLICEDFANHGPHKRHSDAMEKQYAANKEKGNATPE